MANGKVNTMASNVAAARTATTSRSGDGLPGVIDSGDLEDSGDPADLDRREQPRNASVHPGCDSHGRLPRGPGAPARSLPRSWPTTDTQSSARTSHRERHA